MKPQDSKPKAEAADLDALCEALRQTTEQLRGEQPLLDAGVLVEKARDLREALAAFTAAMPEARTADKKDYVSLRSGWLEAWSVDAERMELAVRKALGAKFPEPPENPNACALWRLRLLALMLAKQGPEKTRALIVTAEENLMSTTELGFALAIDREANELLCEVGRQNADDFLNNWSRLDLALVRRAALVVGLAALKRWTRTHREDFHRRAKRFARNTIF